MILDVSTLYDNFVVKEISTLKIYRNYMTYPKKSNFFFENSWFSIANMINILFFVKGASNYTELSILKGLGVSTILQNVKVTHWIV